MTPGCHSDGPSDAALYVASVRALREILARVDADSAALLVRRRAFDAAGYDQATRDRLTIAELEAENLSLRHALADLADVLGGCP